VTEAFVRLAEYMGEAAEETCKLSMEAFTGFLLFDEDLKIERGAYEAFAYAYLRDRIWNPVRSKLGDSVVLEQKLERLLGSFKPQNPNADYRRLASAIEFDFFT